MTDELCRENIQRNFKNTCCESKNAPSDPTKYDYAYTTATKEERSRTETESIETNG